MSDVTDEWVKWRFRNKHEELGKFGERLWQQIMIDCGLFYVPLKDLPPLNGKGPRLQGNDTILPDFDVCGKRRAYLDSKCKTKPIVFEKANEIRQGIDRKDFDAYSTISAINLQKCLLGIIEIFDCQEWEWTGCLLLQTIGVLGEPIRGFSNQSHMVYWPRRKFSVMGTLGPREMWMVSRGEQPVRDDVKSRINAMFVRKEPPIQGRFF